jgi:hypothetical protein
MYNLVLLEVVVDVVLNWNGIRNGFLLKPEVDVRVVAVDVVVDVVEVVVVENDSPDETNPNKTTDVVNRRPFLILQPPADGVAVVDVVDDDDDFVDFFLFGKLLLELILARWSVDSTCLLSFSD